MKKLSLLLASIGAGLLLVGGTVAAYIVTAADTLGVRVSPGSISADTTGRVTLSWKTNTMVHVGNLEPGVDTLVGEVTLGADSDDTEFTTYAGAFNVTVKNLNAYDSKVPDLLDNLAIKIYEDTGSGYGGAVLMPAATTESGYRQTTKTFNAVSGYKYKVAVNLTADAGSESYDQLLSQVAYATFDWGIRDGSEDIDTRNMGNVYYAVSSTALGVGDELYAHIYKGNKVAALYPGVKMTYVYDIAGGYKLYTAAFDKVAYESFKFIKKTSTGTTVLHTKEDGYTDALPYFNGTEWAAKPNEQLAMYYVRGSIGENNYWNENNSDYAMNSSSGTQYSLTNVSLSAGDEIKVYKPTTDEWFGPSNWVITQNGKYDIHVDESHTSDGEGWTNKMIVVNMSYKGTVGSRAAVQFFDNWTADSGADAEYVADFNLTDVAAAGEALAFTKEGAAIASYTAESGTDKFNTETKKFVSDGHFRVYLKLNGSSYSIYVAEII